MCVYERCRMNLDLIKTEHRFLKEDNDDDDDDNDEYNESE